MQPPLSSTTLVYAFDFGILTKNDGKIDLRTMSCCPVNTVQEGASHDVPQSLQKSLYSDILMFHHPAYAINLPVFSSYSPYFHTTSSAVECYILYQLSFISHFHKLETCSRWHMAHKAISGVGAALVGPQPTCQRGQTLVRFRHMDF